MFIAWRYETKQKREKEKKGETYEGFTLFHVFLPEQELPIQIGQVYSVQIQNCDVSETCEDDVLHCNNRSEAIFNILSGLANEKGGLQSSQPMPPAPTIRILVRDS
jgi:hypothetical protein